MNLSLFHRKTRENRKNGGVRCRRAGGKEDQRIGRDGGQELCQLCPLLWNLLLPSSSESSICIPSSFLQKYGQTLPENFIFACDEGFAGSGTIYGKYIGGNTFFTRIIALLVP